MADYAAVFDASTDRALITTSPLSNRAAYTLTCWFCPTSLAAAGLIFSLNNNDMFDTNEDYGIGTDGKLFVASSFFSSTPGTTVLSVDNWYWLAFVRTSQTGDIQIYLDSVQEVTLTDSTEFGSQATRMELGGATSGDLGPLPCRIAYARAWTAALNTTQIAAEKNAVSAVLATNLYGDWPLQSDLNDISGNAHHWTGTGITFGDGPGIAAGAGNPYYAYAQQ